MTGKQLRKLFKQYQIPQQELADRIGISLRTIAHYADAGVTNVPTATLLTLLAKRRITLDDIRRPAKTG